MPYRWPGLFLLVCLIIGMTGVAPAAAEIERIDEPDPEMEREPILDPAEVERIARLQTTVQSFLLSPISPDDSTVLQATFYPDTEEVDFGFLNINDGTITSAGDFVETTIPLSNLAWRDATTMVFVGLNEFFEPAVIAIDRNSGAISSIPLPDIPGFPVSLSPNGTRLLVAIEPDEEAPPEEVPLPEPTTVPQNRADVRESPFDVRLQLRPDDYRHLPASLERLVRLQDGASDTIEVSSDELRLSYFDLNTRETVDLINLPEGSGITSLPAWSQDGSRLALTRITLDSDVAVIRGDTSLANLIVQDALGNLNPASNPLLQGNVVDVFDLTPGNVRVQQLQAGAGNGDTFSGVSWSTDNQTLLTRMQQPAFLPGRTYPVYTYPQASYVRFYNNNLQEIGSFAAREISAPNAMVSMFASPDEVLFYGVSGLSGRIYYYNFRTGEFREISNQPGFYTQVVPTRLSRRLVFAYNSFQTPPDLYRIGWDGTGMTALTFHNVELVALNQVQVHEVAFTLSNGAVRQGYLLQPLGAAFPPQNEPLVVWQEGGPGLFMVNNWAMNVESSYVLLPNFGISVLFLPLSGREGWGPEFYNALAGPQNFGRIDIDEAAEVVRQMFDLGYTAPDRVGVMGCSYGGYFASQSIVRHPDVYAAANPQCSLLDTIVEWQTGFTWFMSYLYGRTPTTASDTYITTSPLYRTQGMRAATLIFHGELDFLPVNIAETFHENIAAAGAPVELLRFTGEGHGLFFAENQLYAAQQQIAWFREHLATGPVQDTAAAPAAEPAIEPAAEPAAEPAPAPPAEDVAAPHGLSEVAQDAAGELASEEAQPAPDKEALVKLVREKVRHIFR